MRMFSGSDEDDYPYEDAIGAGSLGHERREKWERAKEMVRRGEDFPKHDEEMKEMICIIKERQR